MKKKEVMNWIILNSARLSCSEADFVAQLAKYGAWHYRLTCVREGLTYKFFLVPGLSGIKNACDVELADELGAGEFQALTDCLCRQKPDFVAFFDGKFQVRDFDTFFKIPSESPDLEALEFLRNSGFDGITVCRPRNTNEFEAFIRKRIIY